MRYIPNKELIPKEQRAEINKKILYIIENNLERETGITKEDIFNSYTGDGGLHGLEYKSFSNFHDYTEAKKEIEQGQFFTPSHIANFLVDILKPKNTDVIADLTCGSGSFFNYLPNIENVYGNELDKKAYLVAKHLYSKAHITNNDVRLYKTETKFDTVLGNPPFNLKWLYKEESMASQLVYFLKAHEVLKEGGLLGLIVPKSFLNDEFSNKSDIELINRHFNFIFQLEIPSDSFKAAGVSHFETKIMMFQKRSDYLKNRTYENVYTPSTDLTDHLSNALHERYIKETLIEKETIKNKRILESTNQNSEEEIFQYKVRKLLFDIKRNPVLVKDYDKAQQYVERYYTQEKPEHMEYDEWVRKRVTKNKVKRYLKEILKKQHKKEEHKIKLVKTRYGLKKKAYSNKMKRKLNKQEGIKEISFTELVQSSEYPFEDNKYRKLVDKKKKQFKDQAKNFDNINTHSKINSFLTTFSLYDKEDGRVIKLNKIQKEDTGKLLEKRYSYLQWDTGAGKSISSIAQMLYRLKEEQVKNVYLAAPSIAINNNWDDILNNYDLPYIRINKLKDIQDIQPGQIVILTFHVLTKYKRHIKQDIQKKNKKIMFVLDEADSIMNPSSKRTKAALDCFRRSKYKLLLSATSTRNNIVESFTAFELLYNNSFNMVCNAPFIYKEDKKTGDLKEITNDYYKKPFPAYKKGHTLFKQSFSPEKATVFGIGKLNQDIYNKQALKDMIDKTMITRTFEEVSGKELYKLTQDTCTFSDKEKEIYQVIMNEFYKLHHLFKTTGNSRKDSMLRIIQQLNSLLKACVTPNKFDNIKPTKAFKVMDKLNDWNKEKVVIGCTHKETVTTYKRYIEEAFPNRELFIITGDISLTQRKALIQQLKETENGIVLCTQQSLSSSMNIDFVDRILIIEMMWNFASHKQFFARFIRYTSTNQKEVRFLTVENTIESNLLKLMMDKERLNYFMKNNEIKEDEIMDKFGVDYDILNMLLTKETDEKGNSYIAWGDTQRIS